MSIKQREIRGKMENYKQGKNEKNQTTFMARKYKYKTVKETIFIENCKEKRNRDNLQAL